MRTLNLIGSFIAVLSFFAIAACTGTPATKSINAAPANTASVKIQQIRNATMKVTYGENTFLIDPMLADKDAYPGFEGTVNSDIRNPRLALPIPLKEVIDVDAVVVTHTHPDHWDEAAKQKLPKDIPIFVQNAQDAAVIRRDGFIDVRVLTNATEFNGTQLIRTDGQHGTDEMMAKLGPVLGKTSGVVFKQAGLKTLYIAGDTIWIEAVEQAINEHQPEVIVLNTGYALIPGFQGSILMGKEDVSRAYEFAPRATIIGTHMDAVNHATLSRDELRKYIDEENLDRKRVLVPEDGEYYDL